jgi:10 TM Acyl Transferase domain found in Cas1p
MTADQPTKISRTNSSNATTSNNNSNNLNLSSSNRDHSPDRLKKMKLNWPGRREFLKAQAQIAVILVIAAFGNKWEPSYDRNGNHDIFTFWLMNGLILAAGIFTLKHDANGSARGVQLLSRPQTEEWKGWMQWAFIMVREVTERLRYFT